MPTSSLFALLLWAQLVGADFLLRELFAFIKLGLWNSTENAS